MRKFESVKVSGPTRVAKGLAWLASAKSISASVTVSRAMASGRGGGASDGPAAEASAASEVASVSESEAARRATMSSKFMPPSALLLTRAWKPSSAIS